MVQIDLNNVVVEKVSLSQLTELKKITESTFIDTYSEYNKPEDMEKYLETNFSVNQLSLDIESNDSEYYFLKQENTILGYLKLNFGIAQTQIKDNKSVEIERIYVKKEYFGNALGKMLFNQAIDISKKREAPYIWLGVWEKNERAIAFYKKNGFIEVDKHTFVLGEDIQIDITMKFEL